MRALAPVILVVLVSSLVATTATASELYVVVEKTAAPGELVPVTVRTDARQVVVQAWRFEMPAPLFEAGVALDRGESLAWLDPRNEKVTESQQRLRSTALGRPVLVNRPFRIPEGDRPHELELSLGGVGLHLIAVEAGGQVAYATALVSDLGLVAKRAPGSLLVWAVNRTSGRPIQGVVVKVELEGGAVLLASTAEDGTAVLDAALPAAARVRAEWGEHLAVGEVTWHSPASRDRRVYVHTHQPAYRPGERVEIRGILRALEQGRLRLDPDADLARVRLVAPGDREMGSAEVAISADMGTFACGFDLTKEAPTGDWAIVAEIAGKSYEAPLKVDAYRKPSFEVQVASETRRVLVGEAAAFQVHAEWYDGGSLANAPVEWQLLYQQVDRELFPEDELVQLFFGAEREAYRPQTLTTGKGTLDADGRLSIPVTAPEDQPDGFLTLRATVRGPDRVSVVGAGRIGVSTHPIAVALETDRHLYGPEDVARVTVKVERADGRPAPERKGLLTVGLAPPVPEGAPTRETRLHNLPFTTGRDGTAVLTAPLAGAGRYALRVTVLPVEGEASGRAPAHAHLHVWAVGDRATPGHPGAGIQVIADRDAYAVGDVAKLLVLPGGGSRPILATLERDGIVDRGVFRPGEVPPVWTIPLSERHVPNVFATFSMVNHGRLLTTTHVIRIPPRTRLLTTTVTPDQAEIEPGTTSGFGIEVTDASGIGVAGAEVSVAVVDEALFALHADPAAPVEAFFHPPQRNAVGTQALLDWTSVGWAVLARSEDKAEGTAADPAAPMTPMTAAPPSSPAPRPSAGGGGGSGGGGRFRAPADSPPSGEPSPVEAEEMLRDEEAGDDANFVSADACAPAKKGKMANAPALRVREDFRTAIFWEPALVTNDAGRIRVDALSYADSLTRWRITARSVDARTRVGTGTAYVRARRKISARVTLPRFLCAGDRVTFPVLFRNLTADRIVGTWAIEGGDAPRSGTLDLAARALETVETSFASETTGSFPFEARVESEVGGDALRRVLPVLPRGIRRVSGHTLFARDGTSDLSFRVPDHAEHGTVSCRVRIEPAYAGAMVGALPYLLEFPYGCTEQTLNRFLPLLAATEALEALGLPPEGRATELPAMIAAGLDRLARLQHPDGGFGWWEKDATDVGMTALVVHGLSRLLATDLGTERATAIRDRALTALTQELLKAGATLDPTTRSAALLAIASADQLTPDHLFPATHQGWRTLPPMGQALVLRAAVAIGHEELVAALRGLLDDEARREGDFLWWSARDVGATGPAQRWQDDDVETTAVVLLALLEAGVRPEVLDAGTRWLLARRSAGDRWQSTRDTGAAVAFLARLASETGSLGAGRTLTLALDGTRVWEGALTVENAFTDEALFLVPEAVLVPGREVALTLGCPEGAASASVALRYHETGPAIAAATSGFTVKRRFFRLEPEQEDGATVWRRTPVTETLPSGTLVECEVEVVAEEPREYVMVTSPHAGAFEPAREVGMSVSDREAEAESRREVYDDRTMFFVARLAPGRSLFRHLLRATHTGSFTALPAQAELMYFPDVRGNSNGELWQVTPAGPVGEDASEGGR